MIDDDTERTVAEYDNIEGSSFTWTPESDGRNTLLLFAGIVDFNDNTDETEDFVVRAASCTTESSQGISTLSSTSVVSLPSTVFSASGTTSDTQVSLTSFSSRSEVSAKSTGQSSSDSSLLSDSSSLSTSNSVTFIATTMDKSRPSIPSASSQVHSQFSPISSSSHVTSQGSLRGGDIAGIVLGIVGLIGASIGVAVWRWASRRSAPVARSAEEKSTGWSEQQSFLMFVLSLPLRHQLLPALLGGFTAIHQSYNTSSRLLQNIAHRID